MSAVEYQKGCSRKVLAYLEKHADTYVTPRHASRMLNVKLGTVDTICRRLVAAGRAKRRVVSSEYKQPFGYRLIGDSQ